MKVKEERECGICGIMFEVTNRNQKYCPECRKYSDRKKKRAERNMHESYKNSGMQRMKEPCRYCGTTKEYGFIGLLSLV